MKKAGIEQNDQPQQQLTQVYFDGLCHLCSREISHYRSMRGAERLEFVDITGVDFDPATEGLDPFAIHKWMHVRGPDGTLYRGVDGFLCIWSQLPALRWLVPVARFPLIYGVLKLFYALFAKIRPFLPRKSCEASPYCRLR